jgi:Icc-related predicted phosphoesterase
VIRIAAVGDVHFGTDSRGTLRPHLARLGEDADVLLLAGDLTQVGRREEAEVLADELEGIETPVYAVLGNHDYHDDDPEGVRDAIEDAGVTVLDGESASFEIDGTRLGIVGSPGFGGGFAGGSGTAFGEPEMKHFIRRTERAADGICERLGALDVDTRVVLLHYSPVKDTVVGERPEIFPFLGSYLLGRAIDECGADLVLHGHAHAGSERGVTPGGIRVRNVAQPLIRRAYRVFALEPGAQAHPSLQARFAV